jgi:ATP-dependent helicase/nuclease subunit A
MEPDASMLEEAQGRQALASDPGVSAWVGASAGTGKTRVLTDRLLRLLLAEPVTDPAHIVAITFGRLAAAEIFEKLMERLACWPDRAEPDLRRELAVLLEHPPTESQLQRARQLPDLLLDTPPRIATIDGFCHGILQRFPLEAGVSPGFGVLEEEASARLIHQALEKTLAALAQETASETGRAFAFLVTAMSEKTLRETLIKLVEQRMLLEEAVASAGGLAPLLEQLARALAVPPQWEAETMEQYMAEEWLPDEQRQQALQAIAPWLQEGSTTDQKTGTQLQEFLQRAPARQRQHWRAYRKIFFTIEGDNLRKRLATVDTVARDPAKADLLVKEQERLAKVEEGRCARVTYSKTTTLLMVGHQVLQTYAQLKAVQSALDFTDLMTRTVQLLKDRSLGAWVQYRLDKAIHHILVDEAQDTSLGQWHVIEALMEEVLAGEGQHDQPRTLFAVGDVKQSIYRFRGAEPKVFEHMWQALSRGDPAGNRTRRVPLTTSFRASPALLAATDQVFETVALEEKPHRHQSVYPGRFGRVELWEPCRDEEQGQGQQPWQLPVYAVDTPTPRRRLARRVAGTIQALAESPTILATTGQPINYGDMMILLRTRAMLPEIISCLQAQHIPFVDTTGQDGCQHILVQDLIALGLCLMNTDDDLALAQVLKSPLFGWTDEEILALRLSQRSLWDVLQDQGGPTAETLHTLQQKVDVLSPHELYVEALRRTEARGRAMHRLGQVQSAAARRAINQLVDAFLEAALGAESLARFLYDLQRQGLRLEGGQARAADAVRIMTVHKAKGLESPIVFLPDTAGAFTQKLGQEKLLWREGLALVPSTKGDISAFQKNLIEQEKKNQEKDEQRLLYVAMTRAQEYLYIGAAMGKKKQENTWYGLVAAAANEDNGWLRQGQDWVLSQGVPPQTVETSSNVSSASALPDLPDWITQQVAVERTTAQRATEKGKRDPEAVARGHRLHRLLEVLPRLEPSRWEAAAPETPEMRQIVKAVMVEYPWLFGENSRAEVPLGTATTAGIIDRLVVGEKEVRIIDYKTEQTVPARIPAAYRNQLKTYASIIAEVYPDKTVRAGILWTSLLRLDWVDTEQELP